MDDTVVSGIPSIGIKYGCDSDSNPKEISSGLKIFTSVNTWRFVL